MSLIFISAPVLLAHKSNLTLFQVYSDLLDLFSKVPASKAETDRTVFDICGYSHYEDVISNVLAFFLDSTEEHGLGTLVVEALCDAAKRGLDSNSKKFQFEDFQFEVKREKNTSGGLRIDLFLTNESGCIAIENKIFAPLYNDLEAYLACAKYHSENAIGIVLSIHEQDSKSLPESDFFAVTYAQLFTEIRKKLGNVIGGQTSMKHLTLLFDLITNIESLTTPKNLMNSNFIKFVNENRIEVEEFGAELKELHDQLRQLVKQVSAGVKRPETSGIKIQAYQWRNLPDLFDIAGNDLVFDSGDIIAIDSVVNPKEWTFDIWLRKQGTANFDIESHCQSLGLDGEVGSNGRLTLNHRLPVDTPAEVVSEEISKIIEKIICKKFGRKV